MKFGLRTPSLKKRISARTSWKRALRHSAGLKAPRGAGWITNPKKAAYNRIYNKTSFSIDSLAKKSTSKKSSSNVISYPTEYLAKLYANDSANIEKASGTLLLLFFIFIFLLPPVGILILIAFIYWQYQVMTKPKYKALNKIKKAKKSLSKHETQKAEELFTQAFELDNSNDSAIYFLGVIYHDQGKLKEAESYLSRYLVGKPVEDEANLYLANCLYQLEKYDEAISVLQKITDSHPKYLKALQLLAACFASKKEYDMAIEIMKKGPLRKRKFDQDLLEFHYNLAAIYEEASDKKNALKHYRKVYAEDSSFRDVVKKLEILEKR